MSRYNALQNIKKFKIKEAKDILIEKVWQDSLSLQPHYVLALNTIDYRLTEDLALNIMNKIDSLVNLGRSSIDYYEYNIYLNKVLFSLGNYSMTYKIFNQLELKETIGYEIAVGLLKDVVLNVPEYAEQAKTELIYAYRNASFDFSRMQAVEYLEELYGSHAIQYLVDVLKNDQESSNRLQALRLLGKYKIEEVRNLLKFLITKEDAWSIRIDIAKILLSKFGLPEDLVFIKNYLGKENNKTASHLINDYLENFNLPKPDSTTSISIMLDTLKSYTEQCYKYDWIKNEGIYSSLLNLVEKSKDYYDENKLKNTKGYLLVFQRIVEVEREKQITKEGYKFLYYYSGYIMNRLPEMNIVSLLDHLISKNHESYHTRWIFKYSVYVNIVKRLNNIKKAYLSNRLTSAEYMLDSFFNKLNRHKRKSITEEAYEYFYTYSNYIRDKIIEEKNK